MEPDERDGVGTEGSDGPEEEVDASSVETFQDAVEQAIYGNDE